MANCFDTFYATQQRVVFCGDVVPIVRKVVNCAWAVSTQCLPSSDA